MSLGVAQTWAQVMDRKHIWGNWVDAVWIPGLQWLADLWLVSLWASAPSSVKFGRWHPPPRAVVGIIGG